MLSHINIGTGKDITKFISSIRGGNDKNSIQEVFSTVFVFQILAILAIYALFLIAASLITPHIVSNNILTFIGILYIAIPIFFIKTIRTIIT